MTILNISVIYNPQAIVFHCVPQARTTFEFIKKQALGTGSSERLRCLKEGRISYIRRLILESIKWVASILLWFGYCIMMKFSKGNMILFFRFWLTRGLIFKYKGT
jgi:hypothetical protein